ncbi:oligosaccharide flippase family protein [Ferruginibacter sp. SUN106]|uniref:oligosaccharide flippase family protein n=1 Tax=Ferruginibacter sp. SUN106 TaxID=2978348 RepID=UPI003D367155
MKKKFLHDISANLLQVVINQLCGLAIFYILSARLAKNDFGEINWSLAVLLTTFNILSFGIDQVSIKKIASGKDIRLTLSAYVMHVVVSGLMMYVLLLTCNFIFPKFFQTHQFLLLIAIGKLMIFFSTPFKQLVAGLEKFRALLYMAVCSNILRSLALIVLTFTHQLTINIIIAIFIIGDIAELLLCLLLTKYYLKVSLSFQWDTGNYKALLNESLPQLGVAIFTSAMARLDWIFLGLMASNIILANYSFAYKVFEVSTLPLLIIAPLLIPRFTKIFQPGAAVAEKKMNELLILLRYEIIIACGVGLTLNIWWVPVIDLITHNKYGAVNKQTILILSFCLPFLYFINFFWTISFAQGHLKRIFYIFLICFIINLTGTITLIPFFNAEGAAIAYLVSIIVQSLLFYKQSGFNQYKTIIGGTVMPMLCAIAAGVIGNLFFSNVWLIFLASFSTYLLCLVLTKQIRHSHWSVFKQVAGL